MTRAAANANKGPSGGSGGAKKAPTAGKREALREGGFQNQPFGYDAGAFSQNFGSFHDLSDKHASGVRACWTYLAR